MKMEKQDSKTYVKPEIVFETNLETKAGSPLGIDPIDEIELFPGADK